MKKKLKGAALVYVVMMSFIVFLVAGMILLRDYLEYVRLDLIQERDWIRDQVRSVVIVLERDVTGMDGVEQVLPGVPVTFEMKTEEWGLLDVVTLVSGSRMLSDTTILLCGSGYGEDDSTALYMAGNQNYLSVVGNTELRGRCFLPSLGVRKGYVQGEGYYKDSVVYGEVRLSGDSLPGLSSRFVKNMEYAETDEETHDVRVRMRQSFHDEVLTCYSRFPICLTGHVLEGKIRVISEQRIRVDSGSLINHCLLEAPVIEVERGFSGCVQLFASRQILLDTNVTLEYPSAIYLRSEDAAVLTMRHRAFLAGCAILSGGRKLLFTMQPGSLLHGQLYNEGTTQLEGEIWGSAYTRKLRYYNDWGQYEDIIHDGVVDRTRLEEGRVTWDLFGRAGRKLVIGMLP